MIDEKTADLLVERLIRRIEQANTYFLMSIGSSIKQIRELTPTQAHQLVQILKYGGNYDDIVKGIAKYTNLNIKDIEDIFAEYAKKDTLYAKMFYEYRNKPFIPFEANETLKAQTMALSNIVKNEMYNFTRNNVLGYTIRDLNGIPRFYGLRETYNRVLDEALLNVSQGKETFDTAMSQIMKDIGGSGLKTIEYESGRSVRLDTVSRMHLKSRLRELHNENQKLIGEDIDADGVEISVHENPADDHADAQGRQFSNEEYEKLQSGLEAKDYTGKIITLDHDGKNGYRPISEMNCYHYIFSIVLGLSKPAYNEKQLQEIIDRNAKGFEYKGKHYTMYEGTQLQRRLETEIRKQKDTQILAKASGNSELVAESQMKITQLTNKYNKLSQASGLPTKIKRMKVAGYQRTKTTIKYTKDEQYALNKYISPYSIGFNEKLRNHWKLDDTDKMVKRNLDSALKKTPNYNGTIYRHLEMNDPEEFIKQMKVGKEYSTNQYLSFSTIDDYNEHANAKIYVKDSKNSKDLTKINKIGENETLYQRNEKFIVEEIKKKKGIYYIYWKELEKNK